MTKRKLAIPILLVLTLSILSQTLIPSPAAYDSPAIYINPASIVDFGATQITIDVETDYTGADIWGYDFTLTYNPLILSGVSVTNGDVITTEDVTFIQGTFDNTIGKLSLTSANSLDKSAPLPYPPLNNTGPGILATVVFDVAGDGETPITLGDETKLKRGDGSDIVDAYLMSDNIGHGYFRNVPTPNHDVAATGIAFHHSIPATTTFNETLALIYIDATIENQGDVPEIFDVDVYYIIYGFPTLIKSETITVTNGGTDVVSASLNTSGFPVGHLTIKVEASEVYNEVQTNDNTYNTTLTVKVPGDVQGDTTGTPGDGDIDRYDFGAFAQAYGYLPPHAKYNVECDFDRDGDIDRYDFGVMAKYYGTDSGEYQPL